jgi:hypothetical protein
VPEQDQLSHPAIIADRRQPSSLRVPGAVLIDATVVRGILLPAAMALLGERCWYLPRWLSWLPGRGLEPRRAAAGVTGSRALVG